MKKLTVFLLLTLFTAILFQNCSNEFQPLDEGIYVSEFVSTQRAIASLEQDFDQKYLNVLLNSEENVFDSVNLNSYTKNLFLDEATFFVIIKQSQTKSTFNLTVDQDQKTTMTFENGIVSLLHEAPANHYSYLTHTTTTQGAFILSGRVGKDPKNMVLMINGEYLNNPIDIKGNPGTYNYLDTLIASTNTDRAIVFKRALEPAEMNVFSRYLARQYGIETKTSLGTPEVFQWEGASNNQFLSVKSILSQRCFSCHNSWSYLKESDYTKASSYSQNKILIVPGKLKDSPLWYYINGTTDENTSAPRTMPKNAAPLSSSELDTIKNWIMTSSFN